MNSFLSSLYHDLNPLYSHLVRLVVMSSCPRSECLHFPLSNLGPHFFVISFYPSCESPTRGCKNCPMFGVGLNPDFQKKENKRKERLAKAEMKKKMESQNKRAEL